MAPEMIFGSGFWCTPMTEFRDAEEVADLLNVLKRYKINRVDTAPRYPPMKLGGAEILLGENKPWQQSFFIDTKVLATDIKKTDGDLAPEAIEKSTTDSLKRLRVDSVDILYAHLPDLATPIEDQVAAFNSQIDRGRCKKYGLCNHSVAQLEDILRVCEEKDLRKPAVYQSEYNLLTRGGEAELFPLLRKHNIRYFAYRPLAAGFLSGKVVNDQADGTRMAKDSPMGPAYHGVYGSPILHQTMKEFVDILEQKFQLLPLEVSMRWMYYHSALTDTDGIVVGTRSTNQLEQNMQWLEKGPLPQDVLEVVDAVWSKLKASRGSIV